MAGLSLADDCLLKLREYVASLGGTLDGEWKCRAQMRDAGSRAGSVDMWFKSPTGETYRSKVAVARGLGLEPYPDKVAKPAREPGAAPVLRKPRRDPSERQAAPPINRAHLKASPPWIGELSARDLAELLMSMPEGELEDRYQGRLTWKGQTNIRNPAIVVAMELLLESLRPARPPLEPAPPLTAGLVALPNQLSQGGGADGPQVIMSYELPPGTLPEGGQLERVAVRLEVQPEGAELLVSLALDVQQLQLLPAGDGSGAHPGPVALVSIPVVGPEGSSAAGSQPLALVSPLPARPQRTRKPPRAWPEDYAHAARAAASSAAAVESSGEEEVEEQAAVPGAAAAAEQEHDAAVGSGSASDAVMEEAAELGPDGVEAMEVDGGGGESARARSESPESWLSGADEAVADALLGLPEAPLPPLPAPEPEPEPEQQQQQHEEPTPPPPPRPMLHAAAPVVATVAVPWFMTGHAAPIPLPVPPAGAASPLLRPPRPSSESLRGKTPEQVEAALMDRLRRYVHDLGHELPLGWSVKASVRKSGVSAGGIDAYYYAPNGKRYKSMVKVAEVLGLGAVPSPALAGKPCHLAAAAGAAVPMAADGGEAGVARQAISPSARAMGPLAYPMSPQARFETTAFLSPEIELPLAFGLPQQQALADVMAVAAAGGTSLLPPAAAPAPSPLLTLPALPPQLQQAGLYSYSQLIQPQQIGGPDQQHEQAQAGGEAAEHGDGCCAPLYQLQAPQLQQHLPPLQAHDVAMALVAAQAGRAWGSPPLQPLRVPGGSPHAGVGRLGRRGQLLAGRKRRRSLEEAAGAPASPSSSGGSSSSGESSSEDEAEDTHGRQNGSYSSDGEEEGSGDGAAAGASESPRGLAGPGRGGAVLPGGVNQASIGQGQQQGGSRREGSRRRKSQQQPNGTGGAGGGRGSRGGGGSSGGAGGGGGRRPGGDKGGPGRGRRAADGKTAKKRRTKKGGENGTEGGKPKRQRRSDPDKLVNHYDRVFNRLRSQLSRLRQEQALVEAYAADGWRGASREKVKPTAEIKRAKEQIKRIKEVIRDCVRYCDEAEGDRPIPADLFDESGELDIEHMFCSKCKLNHADDDNDIILCDGPCNRAYHVKCLVPPVDPEALPEDEGWLCPACDRKVDMVDLINDEFGTEYELDTPWEDILAPGTLPKSPNAGVPGSPRATVDLGRLEGLLEGADLPSEDEEDEDYVESGSSDEDGAGGSAHSGSGGSSASDDSSDEEGGGGGSRPRSRQRAGAGSASASGGSSGEEEEEEEGEDLRGEVEALEREEGGGPAAGSRRGPARRKQRGGRRSGGSGSEDGDGAREDGPGAGSGSSEGSSSSEEDDEEPVILHHKRRRATVDYRALNAEMFGDLEGQEGELEEEEEEDEVWSPRVQAAARRRRKRAGSEQAEQQAEEEGESEGQQGEEVGE